MVRMTPEFEMLMHDPDLEATRGPGGTLIFLAGGQYPRRRPGLRQCRGKRLLRLWLNQRTGHRQLRS